MAKRTDIHSPSRIIPENYEYVTVRTREDDEFGFGGAAVRQFNDHRVRTGGKFANHAHGGNCQVCGAWMIDYAIFYHAPSNEYIRTGLDCATKIESGHEDDFRRVAQLRRAAKKRQQAVENAVLKLEELGLFSFVETLFENGDISASSNADAYTGLWTEYFGIDAGSVPGNLKYTLRSDSQKLNTLVDMVRNLVRYGSWSEKQVAYATKLVDHLSSVAVNYTTLLEEKLEEYNSIPDVVEGKHKIVGKVVSIKLEENCFAYNAPLIRKMVVKTESGNTLYGTMPASIDEAQVGDSVEFTATVSKSEKDSKFGFFKRPTKASIVDTEAV